MNMEYADIEISSGIKVSQEILNRLKLRKELGGINISIGAFTNCREVGYTYMISEFINGELIQMTFCTYEHRNGDSIIINGKEGYISCNGDLPYSGETKWEDLGSASYEDYDKATDILVENILKVFKK